MPRSDEEIEALTQKTEEWLDRLDPDVTPATDTSDLRRIGLAALDAERANAEIEAGVRAARANGRSWGEIALVLGVTRQAAQQRYGQKSTK